MEFKFGNSGKPSKKTLSSGGDKYPELTEAIRTLVPSTKDSDDNWKFVEWPLIGNQVDDTKALTRISGAIRNRIIKVWGKTYKSQTLIRPEDATDGNNLVWFRVVYKQSPFIPKKESGAE